MSREFVRIGVVGLGTMGAGIAEVFARHGFEVVGVEQTPEQVERGRGHIQHSTDRAVKRGKLGTDEQQAIFDRITLTTDLQDVAGCQLVVEAIVEQLALKRSVFERLDSIVSEDAILATNTSSLSVTEISAATAHPHRVIGMHFFNPAPVQAFVEVIRTVVTAPDVVEDVAALAAKLGKNPVVAGDKAGFIANSLLFGYLNHAASMYESRYATREDIDASMRLGCGYPMGPLALLDLIGLDTAYEILETMYRQGRDRLHAPAPVLKQMVTAGMLGRKTGRGFYTYEAPDSPVVVADAETPDADARPQLRREVRTVGVVGTGTMATGIAQVFAGAGFEVTYVGRSRGRVDDLAASVTRSLDKQIQRGRTDEKTKQALLDRLTGSTSLDDLAGADLVVEAIAEARDVKKTLFENLDEICKPGAILATTTSSLPVIECATATSRPSDVIGMHFFNPATTMQLVEVVSTVTTSAEVAETVTAVCLAIGKHPVACGDRAGFIVNALLFPYLNDAVKMLEAHYATIDDIDFAMTKGCGHPMGPFALMDVVGLDVTLAIQRTLFDEFREPGDAPAPMLEHLVKAGYLGRKTGRGFRDYSKR
ncbi:MAG: 3-hydroxybutyryl-CoA dehydrogenase; 3-hydroxyacyl-CoA dehydrogenase [uncultured Nocardioidaceae bacterium]|uniref:3-hydroxybutyryl-CoA dehydrogenase 3-hydroxyacyl-CoA dehydrogenase n=2 Tax=uncultured Nocardioidaceae bacterium TaxID=253824 RepID=A0A6J4L9U4_9ACTN|nr:MAG: 3-hydroxybutyryl-CoA dehydrogenase; 3-hydroxyacyl-CoA dehydrogenase [uncultured Nocardioidaceae bacterium]